MIDKVILHGATYTSLVQRCLSDGDECDALLLGAPVQDPQRTSDEQRLSTERNAVCSALPALP